METKFFGQPHCFWCHFGRLKHLKAPVPDEIAPPTALSLPTIGRSIWNDTNVHAEGPQERVVLLSGSPNTNTGTLKPLLTFSADGSRRRNVPRGEKEQKNNTVQTDRTTSTFTSTGERHLCPSPSSPPILLVQVKRLICIYIAVQVSQL